MHDRDKAAAEVKRLENPIAAAERFFSSAARKEYEGAQRRYQSADEMVRGLGVTSDTGLQVQRERWDSNRARLPALEEKAGILTKTVERAALAIRGFQLETGTGARAHLPSPAPAV